jgi:two-component system NtrC family sensor kinase
MHPLFREQLKRFFEVDDISGVGRDPRLHQFLQEVNNVYKENDIAQNMVSSLLVERNEMFVKEVEEKKSQQALIRKLEEAHNQLLQSEKMASIGSLAAGVAHEINNPIGFVGSNMNSLCDYVADLLAIVDAYACAAGDVSLCEKADNLAKKLDLTFLREDIVMLLEECRDGISRVRRIVQDLKDFSHVDHAQWVMADLHKGLDSTLNIVSNEIKYKATVEKKYGDLPPVMCIGSQLNQVFMNLLVNAAQSIEGQGVITILTESDKDWVRVRISDTGAGISPVNIKRIFDPFFTTKPVGKGTGLGLSLSYGIVKRHGGKIEVQSEVGVGTSFTVWISLNAQAMTQENEPIQAEVLT